MKNTQKVSLTMSGTKDSNTNVVTNIVDDMTDQAIGLKLYNFLGHDDKVDSFKVLVETQQNNKKRDWDYILNKWEQHESNTTLLIKAIKHQQTSICKLLISMGTNPNADNNKSCLLEAANGLVKTQDDDDDAQSVDPNTKSMKIFELLFDAGADVNYTNEKTKETVLHIGVKKRNVQLMNLILFEQESSNSRNKIEYNWNKFINSETFIDGWYYSSIAKHLLFEMPTYKKDIPNSQIECLKCILLYQKNKCDGNKITIRFLQRHVQKILQIYSSQIQYLEKLKLENNSKQYNNDSKILEQEKRLKNYKQMMDLIKQYANDYKQEELLKLIKYNDIGMKLESLLKHEYDFQNFVKKMFKNDKSGLDYLLNEWNTWPKVSHPENVDKPLLLQAINGKYQTPIKIMLQDLNVCFFLLLCVFEHNNPKMIFWIILAQQCWCLCFMCCKSRLTRTQEMKMDGLVFFRTQHVMM